MVLFVSTGRCGTQWLADKLRLIHGDLARVEHEPLGAEYQSKRFFRAYERRELPAAVSRHLDEVEAIVSSRTYIETGWPLFSAVPAFLERFRDRVRLVHLTRHPVPTAISHMVHKTYAGSPRVDGYTRLAALSPHCEGVFQSELREAWDRMTPYEKTLFWWTEVNLYAEELGRLYPGTPFHRVRSEDLFTPGSTALRDLCRFMGLPWRPAILEHVEQRVDRWRHQTEDGYDWSLIHLYPRAVDVARRLGYSIDDVDDQELAARYSRRDAARHT